MDVRGATMYVTLEPCCHMGKQPPCTLALIEAGIAEVVIARRDPGKNSGGGAEMLREAGINVRFSDASVAAEIRLGSTGGPEHGRGHLLARVGHTA